MTQCINATAAAAFTLSIHPIAPLTSGEYVMLFIFSTWLGRSQCGGRESVA